MPQRTNSPRTRLPLALHYPDFCRLWLGSVVSNTGTQMNNVAKAWILFQLTNSAAALGLEGLCFSLPIALVPMLAGPVVDRVDRLTVIKAAYLVEIVEAIALAIAAGTGRLSPWMIYTAAGVAAVRLSFAIPAGSALVPGLVGETALLSAQSLSAVGWTSSALIGPAIGGALLSQGGATIVFAVNGFCTLCALVALRRVRPMRSLDRQKNKLDGRLMDGIRHIRRSREVSSLMALVFLISTLLIGTETLLPVLNSQIWDAGSMGYSLLRMAPGIAAITVALWLSIKSTVARPFRIVGLGVLVACASLIAFVEAPSFSVAVPLLALGTVGLIRAQVVVATQTQLRTPDSLRGAVGGITAIGQSGLAGIAAAGIAIAATSVGPAVAEIIMAISVAPLALVCSSLTHRNEDTRLGAVGN